MSLLELLFLKSETSQFFQIDKIPSNRQKICQINQIPSNRQKFCQIDPKGLQTTTCFKKLFSNSEKVTLLAVCWAASAN